MLATRPTEGLTDSFLNYLNGLLTGGDKSVLTQETSAVFAKCFRAYLESDNESQEVIREMTEIITDPESDEDESSMALLTLTEALFPGYGDSELGMKTEDADKACCENTEDGRSGFQELDDEEASFATRLERVMKEKGLNQSELAKRAGVGQPAISMMLQRECRPQQRTVRKLAIALDVPENELWPSSE